MTGLSLINFTRGLTRHKREALLTIGGLALGIAAFLVLGLYVHFQTSFEKWLPGHDRVYLVQTEWRRADGPFTGTLPYTMGGLLEQLKQDFPGLVGTRIQGGEAGGSVIHDGAAVLDDIAQVDADFLRVFPLTMQRGDPATALADPNAVVISATAARRYFGTADPIGQTLTITLEKTASYRVTGIFEDLPDNTDLRFTMLTRIPAVHGEDWWYKWGSTAVATYLRFPQPDAARAFTQRLPGFVDRRGFADLGPNASDTVALKLLPIADQHLHPAGKEGASLRLTVATLGLVGLLTLAIAAVNYVNLATARAGLRAREVAVRKVLGGDRAALMRQFLTESVLTAALATLIGLILTELSLPFVNAAGGLSLAIPYALVLPALALLAVVIGVVAGLYPALLLSGFPPAQVLASARTPGGGRSGARIREALVVVQFALATAFIICALVLIAQMRHVRATDLGFERDGLLVVSSLNYSDLEPGPTARLMAAFRAVPGVSAVTTADAAVGGLGNNNLDNFAIPGRPGTGPALRRTLVGSDFFAVYRPRLLAGRLFDEARRTDDAAGIPPEGERNIVINRTAAARLGFAAPQDAIGKTFQTEGPRTIIGVIEDLRFGSPRLPSDPGYYMAFRGVAPFPVVTLRYRGETRRVIEDVRAAWQQILPQVPFIADTGETHLRRLYQDDDRAGRLFAIGTGLAVVIGCLGLWGLAAFDTQRRVKEIGIRKTLGASSADIVRLLVGRFVRPVLAANLLAWPLAFVAARTWLAGFDDRIALSPLFFVAASALAVLIAVLTVIGHALRASHATPAWALRHE